LAERVHWTRSEKAWTTGCLAAISITVLGALLLVANAVAGAPPAHEIHTAGARPLSYQIVVSGPRIVWGRIKPTTSLGDVRCQAWRQSESEVCPDAAELTRIFWPQLQQAPDTLYVGIVPTACWPSIASINIEYSPRSLLIHCFDARPWFGSPFGTPEGGGEAFAEPSAVLVLVPLTGILPGSLQVVYEERVERWFFDAVETFPLGTVSLSG
jgi:hypothetical protein